MPDQIQIMGPTCQPLFLFQEKHSKTLKLFGNMVCVTLKIYVKNYYVITAMQHMEIIKV
jgi:hypothetical protein